MFLRFIPLGVLITGVALLGTACSPTAEASNQSASLEEEKSGTFCGGFAGIPCSEGYTCVDDPNDDCDPNQGGADCGGICQEEKKKKCTGNEPGYNYVSRDPAECSVIRFTCPEGASAFFNDCGCGCQSACNYNDPNRTYVSQDPEQCALIRFTCEPGKVPFFDDCGCGCEPAP